MYIKTATLLLNSNSRMDVRRKKNAVQMTGQSKHANTQF